LLRSVDKRTQVQKIYKVSFLNLVTGDDIMKRVVSGRLNQFDVRIPNEPGSLSMVCDALAKHAVNIKAISTENGCVRLVTEDDMTAKAVLQKANFDFEHSEIMSVSLIDRPGELAKMTKLMKKAGVDVKSIYILGKDPQRNETHIALKVCDIPKATKALGW